MLNPVAPSHRHLFTPTDIASCSLWLDATDLSTLFTTHNGSVNVTAGGDFVGRWVDKVQGDEFIGNAGFYVQWFPYAEGGLGRGVVYFPLRCLFRVTTSLRRYFSTAAAMTIFIATIPLDVTEANNLVYWHQSNTNRLVVQAAQNALIRFDAGNTTTSRLDGVTPGDWEGSPGMRIVTFERDGGDVLIDYGTTSLATKTGAAGDNTTATNDMVLGASSSARANPANCHIGEMIFYDGALTTAERLRVQRYLARRWRVTAGVS